MELSALRSIKLLDAPKKDVHAVFDSADRIICRYLEPDLLWYYNIGRKLQDGSESFTLLEATLVLHSVAEVWDRLLDDVDPDCADLDSFRQVTEGLNVAMGTAMSRPASETVSPDTLYWLLWPAIDNFARLEELAGF